MKTLLLILLKVVIVITSIFIIGILFPLLVAIMVYSTTSATLEECIVNGPFWVVTVVGWLIAACFTGSYLEECKYKL